MCRIQSHYVTFVIKCVICFSPTHVSRTEDGDVGQVDHDDPVTDDESLDASSQDGWIRPALYHIRRSVKTSRQQFI